MSGLDNNTLYLIRSQGCPSCGMSSKISAASSLASKHLAQFSNIHFQDQKIKDSIQYFEGLDQALKTNNCILFYPNTAKFIVCKNSYSDDGEELFSDDKV